MPKLIGNATASAMKDVTSVPLMAINAPYSSLTGSHSAVVMNAKPNSWNAGHALLTREIMIAMSSSSTDKAKLSVTL